MNKLWDAHLFPQSPRYAEWYHVLDTNEVPLLRPMPIRATLGEQSESVYLVDLKRLSPEQRSRLIRHVAHRFGAPEAEVAEQLDRDGHFPIREADVTVAFSLRAFL
jgi:hypothetical protein